MQLKLGISFMLVAALVILVTVAAPYTTEQPYDLFVTVFGGLLVALVAGRVLSIYLTRNIRGLAGERFCVRNSGVHDQLGDQSW